jgi:hypothetical protein
MQAYQVALTLKSRNAKTGPIPVSTTTFETCPSACPLQGSGCYAETGPLAMFWRKVTEKRVGSKWSDFIAQVTALPKNVLWRHNQAGDLPGDKTTIDTVALASLVKANNGKRGFTYTHYDVLKSAKNRKAIASANKNGFTVNLSANNLRHADKLAALGIAPVAVVLPSTVHGNVKLATPGGRKVVVCPATYRDDVACIDCGLCARLRDAIVGFPAHGPQSKKADTVAAA